MLSFRDFLKQQNEGVQKAAHPKPILDIIDSELTIFDQAVSITNRNQIPDTTDIPLDNPHNWLRIPEVTSCFVDMVGSTKLSATAHQNSTAKLYRLFTGTAVKIFHYFEADYIDIKGDGVFALFSQGREHSALAATVTFKTFIANHFKSRAQSKTGTDIIGHYGIDRKTVLVRRLGLRRVGGRTDRQNEVWAGKPINMSAKLASTTTANELVVSKRFFDCLTDSRATMSCGCNSESSQSSPLWSEIKLEDDKFDFDTAYRLTANWCAIHGDEFCRAIVRADTN